jgi:RHS repeat-associated protein
MVRIAPLARSLAHRIFPACLLLCGVALADQILEIYDVSLTTYLPTGKTTTQNCRPRPEQRGVNIDGSLRSAPALPMAISGNPFEAVWRGHDTLSGVRLDTGTFSPTEIDISLPAPGFRWTIGRSYNARQDDSGQFNSNGYQGYNWFQSSQPELHFYDSATNSEDTIYLVYGADRYVEFLRKSTNSNDFKGKNGAAGAFTYASGSPDIWTYTDAVGNEIKFFGGNTSSNRANWQLWKMTDPDGNVAYVGDSSTASTAVTSGYDTSSRMTTAYDTADRRYTYSYSSGTIGGVKRLESVVAETKASGSWSSPSGVVERARVEYAYLTADGDSHGDAGDLKTVTITTPLTDSGISDVRVKYYRYWDGSYDASGTPRANPGYIHYLKLVVDFEGARNYDWLDATFDADYVGATDAALKEYAAAYFEYDSSRRVDQVFFNGQCGCGGAASGTHKFTYASDSVTPTSGYDTAWRRRAVVERPDGTFVTQYFDETGQALSQVITDATPASGSPDTWVTSARRDSLGCIDRIAMPDSVTAYTHDSGGSPSGAITVSSSVGLVWSYTRASSGDFKGFWTDRTYSTGDSATDYLDRTYAYTSLTKTLTDVTIVRPLVDTDRVYSQAITSGTTGSYLTDYGYDAWSGAALSIEKITLTPPAVSTGTNGSNSSNVSYQHLRKDGLLDYEKSPLGYITYRDYTNGQLVTLREDADTGSLAEPSGFTSSGTALDRTTAYAYDAQGRLDTKTLPGGRVEKHYYTKLLDRRLVSNTYPNYSGGYFFGPVRTIVANQAGRAIDQGEQAIALVGLNGALTTHVDEGQSESIAAMDLGTLTHIASDVLDPSGTRLSEHRVYFSDPNALPGTDGTHYDATHYAYDTMGRQIRVKNAAGTVRRTDYDELGRVTARWIGTNDNGAAGGDTSGTNNMVKVEELVYDAAAAGKNSYLTKRTLFTEDSASNDREVNYTNDLRGNVLLVDNPVGPDTLEKYDNMNRLIASGQFTSTSSSNDPTSTTTNRLALSQTFFDERGRVYTSQRHEIDVADGSNDDNVQTLSWYDAEGRLVKVDGETLEKTFYDRLGRVTHRFTLSGDDDSVYADTDDVSGDVVLEEHQTTYDTTGDVVMEATISRHPWDLGVGMTFGALDTNADADALLYTAANLKGRIRISAMWYDANTDRITDRVEYGNNGGSNFDRDPLSVPARADDKLRTSYTYNTDGTLQEVTDPKGLVTRTLYDTEGRRTAVISNYVNGTPSGETGADDNIVRYEYTSGNTTRLWVDLDGDGNIDSSPPVDQVTNYTFGVTKGVSAGDSKISSNDLLKKVQYPDSSDATNDIVAFAYNAQGQQIWKRDQATSGNNSDYTILETVFDDGGRETHRRASQLRAALDTAVKRITTAYDSLGRVSTVTQYDNATVGSGSVVDEVKYSYDNWGNVKTFEQDRNSTVAGGGDDYEVSYLFAKATGGRNTVRRTSVTLPGSKTFDFNYSSTNSSPDANASRVTYLKDGATELVRYDYLGTGTVVGTTYDEPDVFSLNYSGTSYTYLDAFNRITTSRWTKDLATDSDFYKVDLGYDRNSNITSSDEAYATSNGHGHAGFDVIYTMDDVNRLTRAEEGTKSGGSITSRTRDELWTLTQTGNWELDQVDLDGDDNFNEAGELNDDRTHNAVNELTARDTDDNGTDNYTLAFDAAGNMTDDGRDYTYTWDAFGRLRLVNNRVTPFGLVAEYKYNGLGYRISVHQDTDTDNDVDGSDKWYHFAYDERWRMVATYRESDSSPKERFLPQQAGAGGFGGSSYIDLVAFREKDANTAWTSASDGTLEERLYYCQNQHADVVGLVTSGGAQREMDRYSAYGVPFGLPVGDTNSDGDCDTADRTQVQTWIDAPNYDVRGDLDLDGDVDATDKSTLRDNYEGITLGRTVLTASAVGDRRGHAGSEFDSKLAGTNYHVRHRVLGGELGRWFRRDPNNYSNGYNLYLVCLGAPTVMNDPLGLESLPPDPKGGGEWCQGDCVTDSKRKCNFDTFTIKTWGNCYGIGSIPPGVIKWWICNKLFDAFQQIGLCGKDNPCAQNSPGPCYCKEYDTDDYEVKIDEITNEQIEQLIKAAQNDELLEALDRVFALTGSEDRDAAPRPAVFSFDLGSQCFVQITIHGTFKCSWTKGHCRKYHW